MRIKINLAALVVTVIVLFVYDTPIGADDVHAGEAPPTENSIDAPPPPLLQAEPLVLPTREKSVVEIVKKEVLPPKEDDPWPIISKGMILLKSEAEGEIVASEDPKELLGLRDIVYLKANQAPFSPEEELVVYRVTRPVFHPKTISFLGDLVQILGVVRVKSVGEDVATAEIILSKNTISRKDKIAYIDHFILTPIDDPLVSPEEGLEAIIVETPENHVSRAQHDIVYIDRGRDEGVSAGDQFIVIHGGERQGAFSEVASSSQAGLRLPYREVGSMVVLATQEHTATAKITRSLETISKGDQLLYVNGE